MLFYFLRLVCVAFAINSTSNNFQDVNTTNLLQTKNFTVGNNTLSLTTSGFPGFDPNGNVLQNQSHFASVAVLGGTPAGAFTIHISGAQGQTTVPEPGTVAMLVGMGVSGSAFVMRRRRAVK